MGTAVFVWLSLLAMPDRLQECLPENLKLSDVIAVQTVKSGGGTTVKKITVNEKLKELKARCKKRKLVDGAGREIRFYRLIGCWGNPPADYSERMQRQQDEINDLKKRYAVVEIPCSLSTSSKQIH